MSASQEGLSSMANLGAKGQAKREPLSSLVCAFVTA
jgi:hypothetical protein